jgi:hypothetical protein
MAAPRPTVRSLIVCEDIVTDRDHPTRVSLIRLTDSIRPAGGYPSRRRQVCVFAQLTECRGAGTVRVEVREADGDRSVFRVPDRRLTFPNDPLTVHGLRFRIADCPFPHPGLYWVQLWYDDGVIAQCPLTLR